MITKTKKNLRECSRKIKWGIGRAGCRSWGTIVLSQNYQKRSHRSKKKNKHLERLLTELTWNERIFLEKNVQIRNTFLLSGTLSKSYFESGKSRGVR